MATQSNGQADGDDPPSPVSSATSPGGQSACEEARGLRNDQRFDLDNDDAVCAVDLTAPKDDGGQLSISETKPPALDGGDAEEPKDELRGLVDEVAAIRGVLESPLDVERLEEIRSWEHRTTHTSHENDEVQLPKSRLIPIAPPSNEIRHECGDDSVLLRVVAAADGTFRGQVKRCSSFASPSEVHEAESTVMDEFIPHGWGVMISRDGTRRVGQWSDGEQVGVGMLQNAVLHYNGEWRAAEGPCGYGIGVFAFGATFVGCWHNGRPCGLGRLQWTESLECTSGWFYGLHCLQSIEGCSEALSTSTALSSRLFDDQPYRGLFLVGKILEDVRLRSLQAALGRMRSVACAQVVEIAKRRSWEVIEASVKAYTCEWKAITWDVANHVHIWRSDFDGLLDELQIAQARHNRIHRIREYHANQLATAVLQRDLAQRCVMAQEETVHLLKLELSEVLLLLNEAVTAQDFCRHLSNRLQHIKREIEIASVKINALRNQRRQRVDCDNDRELHQDKEDMSRTPSNREFAKAFRRGGYGSEQLSSGSSKLQFVCDVPDCSCGIPRDVFTRVAAVLNGE